MSGSTTPGGWVRFWDKAQNEPNAAFEKLQTSVAEIANGLKRSLGLDQHSKPPGAQTR